MGLEKRLEPGGKIISGSLAKMAWLQVLMWDLRMTSGPGPTSCPPGWPVRASFLHLSSALPVYAAVSSCGRNRLWVQLDLFRSKQSRK